MKNKYELMFIISSTLTEEQRETVTKKVSELLVSKGAEIEKFEKLGMKKLAYPINFKNEGFYCLVTFTAPTEAIIVYEKNLNITEDIVRSLIVCKK